MNTARFAHTIYQEDMQEAEELARAIGRAKRAYKKKMRALETSYRAGARVEPGFYAIEDVLRRGGGAYVAAWEKPGIRIRKKKAS